MSDFFLIDRGIFDHPLFGRDAYSRREAWIWMVGSACFKTSKIFINGKVIEINRGQLSFSIRFMAGKWLWDKAKVERFFSLLKTETMIETQNETGQLIITICNYDKYQITSKNNETAIETQNETGARQERDRSETKKKEVKELKKEKKSKEEPIGELFSESEIQFSYDWLPAIQHVFDEFKKLRKEKKKPLTGYAEKLALKQLDEFKKQGANLKEIIEQSIFRGWDTFYPLKTNDTSSAPSPARSLSYQEQKELKHQQALKEGERLYEQHLAEQSK